MKVKSVFGGGVYESARPEIEGGTKHFGAVKSHEYNDDMHACARYEVIHRGTGACVAKVCRANAAIALMTRLEALPVNWAFRTKGSPRHRDAMRYLGSLPKGQRRGLSAVYDASTALRHGRDNVD